MLLIELNKQQSTTKHIKSLQHYVESEVWKPSIQVRYEYIYKLFYENMQREKKEV